MRSSSAKPSAREMLVPFNVHRVSHDDRSDHLCRCEPTPNSKFLPILGFREQCFKIVLYPEETVPQSHETVDKENGLVTPDNVFEQLWSLLVPLQHAICIRLSHLTTVVGQLLASDRFPWTKIELLCF